jgi:hypothetical protein
LAKVAIVEAFYLRKSSGSLAIFAAIRRAKQCIGRNQQDHRAALFPYSGQMDVTFIYRCPRTGLQVQGRIVADHPTDCEIYEPVACTACAQVHLVNVKSGKVLETPSETEKTG